MGKKETAAKSTRRRSKKDTTSHATEPATPQVAKLDPTLLLGALRTKEETSGVLKEIAARLTAGIPAAPRSLAEVPVGIQSIADQLAPSARNRFYQTDRVPVLVEVSDAANVVKRVAAWKGEAVKVAESVLSILLPRDRLMDLAKLADVRYVEASHRLKPHCDLAHQSARLFVDGSRAVPQTGAGVLIGVVDTGIDVKHPAFWSGDDPRIVQYHDQEQDVTYTAADVKNGQGTNSPDVIGHGTHVAGIAGGNGAKSPNSRYAGVAPQADLAIVKTSFQSDDIAKAVKRIFDLAHEREQPCVVNLSLGGHYGGHDGSTITERTIDDLSGRGRIVVVSAGNEGSDRIHASTVLARDPSAAQWTVDLALKRRIVNGQQIGLLFLQVWHQHEDDLQVRLRSPNGEFFEPSAAGDPQDRGNFIVEASQQVSHYSGDPVTTFVVISVPRQQWLRGWSIQVRARPGGDGVQVGAVHSWILDEEMGEFTQGFTRSHLVGMPGTAYSAVTVASYATRREWPGMQLSAINLEDISYFSSPGPTREGHNKPEIAAPGQYLLSALSQDASEDWVPAWTRLPAAPYAAMQGTSMAAPYVTGALALLLEKDPHIEWAEAKRRLIKSAGQDEFTQPCWNNRWGYGKIDVERLLTIEPGPGLQ